jgi:hypothetical protein
MPFTTGLNPTFSRNSGWGVSGALEAPEVSGRRKIQCNSVQQSRTPIREFGIEGETAKESRTAIACQTKKQPQSRSKCEELQKRNRLIPSQLK